MFANIVKIKPSQESFKFQHSIAINVHVGLIYAFEVNASRVVHLYREVQKVSGKSEKNEIKNNFLVTLLIV